MDQHAVPQDITGFKFKLVGDMTVKQFGELAGGAILAYIFYIANWHPILKFPFVGFFALMGVALAFFPVQERPLDLWLINFFKAIYRPTVYVWKRQNMAAVKPQELPTPPKTAATSTLKQSATPQINFTPITIAEPLTAQVPLEASKESVAVTPPPVQKPGNPGSINIQQLMANRTALPTNPSGTSGSVTTTEVPPLTETQPAPSQDELVKQATLSIETLEKLRQDKLKELAAQKATPAPMEGAATGGVSPSSSTITTPPPTPGRIMTIDALETMRKTSTTEQAERGASELSKNEALVNELVDQNKALMMQIDEIKNNLVLIGKLSPSEQQTLDALTEEKTKLSAQITQLRGQITDQRVAPLRTAAYQAPAIDRKPPQVRVVDKVSKQPVPITLTEVPNVINGVILDHSGNPIDGTILIIKDKAGNSIRALKANRVGQFIGSTPLESGTYYLELEKQNFTFDVLEITLNGGVLAPLEIRPKVAPTVAPATGMTPAVAVAS